MRLSAVQVLGIHFSMEDVVFVLVGQCGVQLGAAFFERIVAILSRPHGTNTHSAVRTASRHRGGGSASTSLPSLVKMVLCLYNTAHNLLYDLNRV